MPKLTLVPITNRSGDDKFALPEDGWIHIAPVGEYPHPSGIIQVLDDESIEAMVNRFKKEAKAPNFPGLLLDFDHFSNDTKAPSAAAGWIEDLQNREDGLWAKVRWSKTGKDSIEGGDYRLCSPVWNRRDCEDLGNNRFRPERLDRCALTNDPVLKGMTPVSNRAGTADNADLAERLARAEAIIENLKNAGTSAGAHKGWETRRGALAAYHKGMAKTYRTNAGPVGSKPGSPAEKWNHEQADRHEKLAAGYEGKARVSGAKAHINAQLDKMRAAKKPSVKPPKDPLAVSKSADDKLNKAKRRLPAVPAPSTK